MSEYLPEDVRSELRSGRDLARSPRLRLVAGGVEYPVLRLWSCGFSLDLAKAPRLRGLVDLYDGERHLCQALVLASRDEDGVRQFEFKYANRAIATPPAVDFARVSAMAGA